MRSVDHADLVGKIAAIDKQPGAVPSTSEVAGVVEEVLASLQGEMSVADLKLYRELEHLAEHIQRAKREMAEIRPHDISEHIPLATDELDAVVDHTAEATGTILDAAESMEKLAATLPRELGNRLTGDITRIYEACNFQDITGQRITKVVNTLKYIEAKIDALLAAFGDGIAAPASAAPAAIDKGLMSGPQLPGNANSQDEIDALLAQLDQR